MDPLTDLRTRRRAATRLVTLVLAMVLVTGAVVALLVAHNATTPTPNPTQLPTPPVPTEPGWDLATEPALATRPMLALPMTAAQPHELTTQSAGPDLTLPTVPIPAGR